MDWTGRGGGIMVKSAAMRFGFPAPPDRTDTGGTASAAAVCRFYWRWLWEKRKRKKAKKRKNVAANGKKTAANGVAIARRANQTDWQYFGEDGTMEKPAEK
jgi:hypothetical protein